MEALTGASVAALTIYDMCKALSHDIVIAETRLIEKRGGKSDHRLTARGTAACPRLSSVWSLPAAPARACSGTRRRSHITAGRNCIGRSICCGTSARRRLCPCVPISADDPTRAEFPQIVDRQPGLGPIAGISAALQEHPKAAWLVLACDLPFLTETRCAHLIAHRDPSRLATAYRSATTACPNRCARSGNPRSREPLLAYIATGKQCPRKFLINADAASARSAGRSSARQCEHGGGVQRGAAASRAQATGDGYERSRKHAGRPQAEPPSRTVRVQYYADPARTGWTQRRDDRHDRRHASRSVRRAARSVIRSSSTPQQLKVALNAEFSDWQTPLKHGDTVVFIPPVAGG